MENASKALIIAGAILLAILIISLGILIYNQASSVVQDNAMSQVETQQFNQQFTQYEGTRVRGSTVRALYQAVLANNVAQDSVARKVAIVTSGLSADAGLAEDASNLPTNYTTVIQTGSSYSVVCSYGSSGADAGLVNQITISAATN